MDDTIAAIITPEGVGGVAAIRISGNKALEIAKEITETREDLAPRLAYNKKIKEIDEVILIYYKAPKSYTGEDSIEISCHGNGKIARYILGEIIKKGARIANPGEFTKRAYLNGKIDLTQAESVIEIVSAKTLKGIKASYKQLSGSISKEVNKIREEVLFITARIEAGIDFPDNVENKSQELEVEIGEAQEKIKRLLCKAEMGRIYREGIRVCITGRPNTGKSSLLNALIKEERAIVTEHAGTTRDTIEEAINIGGAQAIIIDTAGIREPGNMAEKMGVERAKKEISRADLVLLIYDGNEKRLMSEDEKLEVLTRGKKRIFVKNKKDLGIRLPVEGIEISAKTGEGIERLEEEIESVIMEGRADNAEGDAMMTERHRQCLARAGEGLKRAGESIRMGQELDLTAIELKEAISALGELTGIEISDKVIEQIFSRFCVGK